MKELIIAAAIIVAVIIFIIIISASMGKKTPSKATSAKTGGQVSSTSTYAPGVYTSSLTINGEPMDVKVTVDSAHINSIELENLSESIATMYPMLSSSFDELASQVQENGSTQNIIYNSDEKYTAVVILDAIDEALKKAE